ncbi:MAG: HAMP domain-containing histidine kinase, partial [Armatimonadetes bacterium]|nr:HAMP domain-containing histidine kinase [Anaerolineae bacterium]
MKKNTFLTDFFSTISHDLKTPLTTINTGLYLLKRAENQQQREERTIGISEQIGLIDKYLQDMLTIARLEHLPTLNFETLRLNPLVEQVAGLLHTRIEAKQLDFHVVMQPNLPTIRGD